MIREGHAVPYAGGDKAKLQQKHLENRQRLIDEDKVPVPEGMTKTKGAYNEFKATKPPRRAKKKTKK